MDLVAVASLASDLILALTMIVFLVQSRHMARATRASVYQTVAEQMMSVDRLFIDHPELRPYLYDGQELPADPRERSRITATAELLVDFLDNIASQSRHIPDYLCGPWYVYFQDLARSSPAMRQFWLDRRSWYGDDMRRLLDDVCGVARPVGGSRRAATAGAPAPNDAALG